MTRADPAQQIKRTQMDLAIQRWTPVCCFPAATSLHLKNTGKCKGGRWTEGWAHANEEMSGVFLKFLHYFYKSFKNVMRNRYPRDTHLRNRW